MKNNMEKIKKLINDRLDYWIHNLQKDPKLTMGYQYKIDELSYLLKEIEKLDAKK